MRQGDIWICLITSSHFGSYFGRGSFSNNKSKVKVTKCVNNCICRLSPLLWHLKCPVIHSSPATAIKYSYFDVLCSNNWQCQGASTSPLGGSVLLFLFPSSSFSRLSSHIQGRVVKQIASLAFPLHITCNLCSFVISRPPRGERS